MSRATRPLLFLGYMLSACLLILGLGRLPVASAHDELISTSPADGSSSVTAPAAVSLKFSDAVLAIGSEVVVSTAAGTNWVAGEPAISGATVTARLRPGGPSGRYTVAWRVVSADGHPVSGTFGFTVKTGSNASSAPATRSPAPSLSATASAAPGSTSTAPGSDSSNDGMPIGATWGAGGVAVVAAASAAFLVRRRKKH